MNETLIFSQIFQFKTISFHLIPVAANQTLNYSWIDVFFDFTSEVLIQWFCVQEQILLQAIYN